MSDITIRAEGPGKKDRRGVEAYGSLLDRLRLGKGTDEFWASRDVSFEVKHGEVVRKAEIDRKFDEIIAFA